MTFAQQQLWYKEQKVLALWACSLNDRTQNKQLAAFLRGGVWWCAKA
jgi:hypothetical protein